jgi:hypothetical protein
MKRSSIALIKKILLLVLSITWELPQTILGALFFLVFYPFKDKIESDGEFVYTYVFRKYPGMALGRFIFVMARPEKNYKYSFKGITRDYRDLVNHERGHSIQSRILGPFYLVIIFPSGLWFVFTSIVELILDRRFTDYYGFYTEYWADALGKVKNRSARKGQGPKSSKMNPKKKQSDANCPQPKRQIKPKVRKSRSH